MADVSSYKVYGTLPTIPEEQVQKLIEQSEGGTLPEVTTTDNGKVLTVVEGAWDKAEASGSSLPEVTAADNGKVLTVVEGEWDKVEAGGGGGGGLVVKINRAQDGINYVLDKTWIEIYTALQTTPVAFMMVEEDGDYYYIQQHIFSSISYYEGAYMVTVGDIEYTTSSENGYPTTNSEG